MTLERARLIAAIDCCQVPDGCEMCPMMDECCDDFKTRFIEFPVPVLEEIRRELKGEGARVQ